MSMNHWWNDNWNVENWNAHRETIASATLPTTDPTEITLGLNTCLRGKKLVANSLRYGIALGEANKSGKVYFSEADSIPHNL
jgi:hypothetical protein